MSKKINLIIDASTTRSGGGLHFLGIILKEIDCIEKKRNINLLNVYVSREFFEYSKSLKISKKIIEKYIIVNFPIIFYPIFQFFFIPKKKFRNIKVVYLVLSSLNFIKNKNVVIMPQNLLPFDFRNIKNYGLSKELLRLLVLRLLGTISFLRSRRIIFLSEYQKKKSLKFINFNSIRRKSLCNYLSINLKDIDINLNRKYKKNSIIFKKFLYVSRIDFYKNQDYVIKELSALRLSHLPDLTLKLPGLIYEPYFEKNKKLFSKNWIEFPGNISYPEIIKLYKSYDIAIFASSCEACPTIILEMMKYGIPFLLNDLPLYDELVPLIYPRFKLSLNNDLKNKILELYNNPKLVQEIIIAGKKKVKYFEEKKMTDNLINKILFN